MRVLVFGASTVQGYWDSQGGWADRLKRYYDQIQLKDLSKDVPHVMNLGISGDGSAELLERIDPEIAARQNDKGVAVVISIGTNSAAMLRGEPVTDPGNFQAELKRILLIAKKYTNKILLVGLPAVDESKTDPVAWFDMRFKNDRIKEFENHVKDLAYQEGIGFVAVHDIMQSKTDEIMQSHDGLHPNDAGHQFIFELVRPAVDKMLEEES
ncbi:MAG TPA: GDSL-type esterase/lipase family protein [Candidatus Saccharimonadales bacterium]|nr:GDSL-type esterase/lipase family protein [Candidatus Saccharimonadales bacterium]